MSYLNAHHWQPSPTRYPIHLPANNIHIWHFTFNTMDSANTYWQSLSTDEQMRAQQFYFTKDQKAYIFSRGILREILSRYLGIAPNAIQLKCTSYGKPLIDPSQNLDHVHFNVSHTHQSILYAFTKNIEIGVDIEYLKNNIDYQSMTKHFFSQSEYKTLMQTPENQQHALFYKIWTCKEAFIKAIGLGLSYPLADFDVHVENNQTAKISHIKQTPLEAKLWSLYSLNFTKKHIGAVATKQPVEDIAYYLYS